MSCSVHEDNRNKTCGGTRIFEYVSAQGILLEIKEMDRTIQISGDDGSIDKMVLYDSGASGEIVFRNHFAITPDLLAGGRYRDDTMRCESVEVSVSAAVVKCDNPFSESMKYTFTKDVGVTRLWFNEDENSVVELKGQCGLGSDISSGIDDIDEEAIGEYIAETK